MDFAAKPIRKARGIDWMHKLRIIFPYGLHDRVRDEFKTDNKQNNVATKFSSWSRKHSHSNREKNHKVLPFLYHNHF